MEECRPLVGGDQHRVHHGGGGGDGARGEGAAEGEERTMMGRLQVETSSARVESAWFQLFKLETVNTRRLLSCCKFNFNLHRATMSGSRREARPAIL